jgi:hypothetical protein
MVPRQTDSLRDILGPKIGRQLDRRIAMNFTIELEQEVDGRWVAEVPELRGALVAKGQALALRVLAEQLEHNEQALI